jgi:hypothetical protein
MSTTMSAPAAAPAVTGAPAASRLAKLLAILLIVAGAVMVAAGVSTWITVQNQLAQENITVSEQSPNFAGEPVDGPLTAYVQAQVIEAHALAMSGGKTYAELALEDPRRAVVMNASFLRASLFTSVVAFGVAAMATGLGVLVVLIGLALLTLARRQAGAPVAQAA